MRPWALSCSWAGHRMHARHCGRAARHAVGAACPACGTHTAGGWDHRRTQRQPLPQPHSGAPMPRHSSSLSSPCRTKSSRCQVMNNETLAFTADEMKRLAAGWTTGSMVRPYAGPVFTRRRQRPWRAAAPNSTGTGGPAARATQTPATASRRCWRVATSSRRCLSTFREQRRAAQSPLPNIEHHWTLRSCGHFAQMLTQLIGTVTGWDIC